MTRRRWNKPFLCLVGNILLSVGSFSRHNIVPASTPVGFSLMFHQMVEINTSHHHDHNHSYKNQGAFMLLPNCPAIWFTVRISKDGAFSIVHINTHTHTHLQTTCLSLSLTRMHTPGNSPRYVRGGNKHEGGTVMNSPGITKTDIVPDSHTNTAGENDKQPEDKWSFILK